MKTRRDDHEDQKWAHSLATRLLLRSSPQSCKCPAPPRVSVALSRYARSSRPSLAPLHRAHPSVTRHHLADVCTVVTAHLVGVTSVCTLGVAERLCFRGPMGSDSSSCVSATSEAPNVNTSARPCLRGAHGRAGCAMGCRVISRHHRHKESTRQRCVLDSVGPQRDLTSPSTRVQCQFSKIVRESVILTTKSSERSPKAAALDRARRASA
jgi:hypothetical protein